MLGVSSNPASVNDGNAGIHCVLQPDGSVRLQWDDSLSLHLEYGDLVRALECLEDVLKRPAYGFSLAGNSFCAFHSGDGSYYLLCGDHVVLRFSEYEAHNLRYELEAARTALDHAV